MRRRLSKFVLSTSLVALAISMTAGSASARNYAHEDHCFSNGPTTDIRYAEDDYADGTLSNNADIEAVERLNDRLWQLRLTGLPLQDAKEDFLNSREAYRQRFLQSQGVYPELAPWHSPSGALRYNNAAERDSRRTGSKYFYVTPAQKELARQRSLVRAIKQKPCNPNITYLGTN